jgi:hypothetical protein
VKKLLQLLFGDARNASSVALALVAACGLARIAPDASGALLALLLIGSAALRAF